MAQLSSRYICLSHIGHSSWNFKVTISLTLNISCEKLCDLVPFHPLRHIHRVSVNLCSRLEKALREFMYLSSYQKPSFPLWNSLLGPSFQNSQNNFSLQLLVSPPYRQRDDLPWRREEEERQRRRPGTHALS